MTCVCAAQAGLLLLLEQQKHNSREEIKSEDETLIELMLSLDVRISRKQQATERQGRQPCAAAPRLSQRSELQLMTLWELWLFWTI